MQVRQWLNRVLNKQRPVGAVFAVSLAILLALIAGRGWRWSADSAAPTPRPLALVQSVAEPIIPSPSPTHTVMPSSTPTMTPEPTAPATATAAATINPTPTEQPTAMPTARPLPTPDGVLRTASVPILMYHYISHPPKGSGPIRRDLSVPPEVFAEHLAYLQAEGYTSISLEDLVLALQIGHSLPDKPIVLTFDDGYRDHYDEAFPLLQAHGFTGTFFVITSLIDQGNPGHLTWEQVIEMDAAGMAIEPHGYTHDDLQGKPRDYLIWQMLGSKEAIEARTNKPTRFYCYPSGSYDEHVIQVARELDLWGGTTTRYGWEHHPDRLFELERMRIHGNYGVAQLDAILNELAEIEPEALP